ncbi:hypothetical protein [Sulfobacillus thermosulfidooxidans]|uniref:hypothetical protein n=1 Tax=Sulfobacillus thermosulfidooxidans TaxID=28034 RepID=UPI00096BCE12|nr:hypothetical protein [Sulfobacillus thermosulfidooxidans]OLZ09082.1 hypothetical protein BFX05_02455 [Sulfobacillus thermosulfidooxidans]OLZ15164.1 hypothetical protein BFX06_04290 [Sulfobacillus thermosulfidooxidans]OLZ22153.1 hypothetical protein BFX07_09810 [Sulfobacillus thermosulfidooxidans]
MLSRALTIWQQALQQAGTWTAIVWTAAFSLLLFLVLALIGAGGIFALIAHPAFMSNPNVLSYNMARFAGSFLIIDLILLAAGPFLTAAIYGLYGQAVRGERVSWETFWIMGRRLYGRGWGFILYIILYFLALMIFAGILVMLLHRIGVIVVLLSLILSMPWVLRMAGGLFVDQLPWSQSFAASFRSAHYGSLLLGIILTGIVYIFVIGLVFFIIHSLGFVGSILMFLIDLVLSVAGPVWLLSLYVADQS